ncbi:unnamed protein product, partial [Prorocentrum cordatum]
AAAAPALAALAALAGPKTPSALGGAGVPAERWGPRGALAPGAGGGCLLLQEVLRAHKAKLREALEWSSQEAGDHRAAEAAVEALSSSTRSEALGDKTPTYDVSDQPEQASEPVETDQPERAFEAVETEQEGPRRQRCRRRRTAAPGAHERGGRRAGWRRHRRAGGGVRGGAPLRPRLQRAPARGQRPLLRLRAGGGAPAPGALPRRRPRAALRGALVPQDRAARSALRRVWTSVHFSHLTLGPADPCAPRDERAAAQRGVQQDPGAAAPVPPAGLPGPRPGSPPRFDAALRRAGAGGHAPRRPPRWRP